MRRAYAAVWFLLAFIVFTGAPAEGTGDRPTLQVDVRIDTARPLDGKLVREVTETARRIWKPYVELTFVAGDVRLPTAPADTLHLVITDRTLPGESDSYGLGWIQFVNGRPSHTIVASIAAVDRLAAGSSWGGRPMTALPASVLETFRVRSMAGAVAHEVGHYLLKSKMHSRAGLMRERFAVREIMEWRQAQYRLDPADERRLQGRLLEYAQADPARSAGMPPS